LGRPAQGREVSSDVVKIIETKPLVLGKRSRVVMRFALSFRAATGDLIRASKLSLAEIAYACGFSSQSHMTTAFSNQLGETPGAIRKGAKG